MRWSASHPLPRGHIVDMGEGEGRLHTAPAQLAPVVEATPDSEVGDEEEWDFVLTR